MRVLLAGATGAVGTPLTRALLEAGHEVVALTRRRGGAPDGTTELVADALDRDGLLAAVRGLKVDAVMHQLTALRKAPMRHSGMAPTNRLRIEGTANLLAAARAVGARRFVTQSNLFGYGYGNLGDHFLTEKDTFGQGGYGRFDQHIAALRSTEEQTFNAEGIDGIALRYGAFYGAPGDPLIEMIEQESCRRCGVGRSPSSTSRTPPPRPSWPSNTAAAGRRTTSSTTSPPPSATTSVPPPRTSALPRRSRCPAGSSGRSHFSMPSSPAPTACRTPRPRPNSAGPRPGRRTAKASPRSGFEPTNEWTLTCCTASSSSAPGTPA